MLLSTNVSIKNCCTLSPYIRIENNNILIKSWVHTEHMLIESRDYTEHIQIES